MVKEREAVDFRFQGSAAERELASRVLHLMLARGMFMSADAPIRVSLSSLASFLDSQGEADAHERLEAALAANPENFDLEAADGDLIVVTTRDGKAPRSRQIDVTHSFAERFLQPRPKPERPAAPRARPKPEAPFVDVLEEIHISLVPEPLKEEELAPTVVVEAPAVEEPPVVAARTITTQVARPTDVKGVDDLNLAVALKERLGSDPRVANFGEQWLLEERVPRFSRGDLRRLRDYVQEKEQPVTDDDLVQDVLGVRPSSPDFELMRFALNFRLSNEHREFEFVGTKNQRFWSTSGLPQIGTTRRKLNEIGTDYRYLLDEAAAAGPARSVDSIDHILTFYEFIHGLLPFDTDLRALLPAPMTPHQKSAVMTFECPQSFTTYLVELRYETPNRGGFILGLDDFYAENLVPGAILSIQRTENDGHYRVEFLPESATTAQVLELDERRTTRYVFRPTTFACGIDPSFLLNEERFGGLANERPLDDKARRRPEAVVAATFERIGEARDGNYSLPFETLLAGVNIERPFSAELLRSTLDTDDSGAFSRDPEATDSYTYVPGTSS